MSGRVQELLVQLGTGITISAAAGSDDLGQRAAGGEIGVVGKLLVRAIWHDQSREAVANLTSTATGPAPTAARDWLASSAIRRSMAATVGLGAL